MKKRVLAIMLACMMLVSVLPMGSLAAGVQICPDVHTKDNCEYTLVRVQAPTCDEKSTGYTIYSCNLCGELFAADFVDGDGKGEHTFETVLDKDGNCAVNTCTVCGTEVAGCPEDILSKPNCTEPATCPLCGKEHGTVQHTWPAEPTKILSEPNEKTFESGWALYTCEDCGATEKFEILAHDCAGENWWKYVDYVYATTGSCTETGVDEHYECRECGRLYWFENGNYVEVTLEDLTIKAAGHTAPVGTLPVKVPTCTTTGLLKYTCVDCGEEIEEILPVQHTWDEAGKVEIKATCTTYGYVIKACLLCTEGNEFTVTDPTGHSERPENALLTPATCTSNAYYTWICTNENCSNVDNVATEEVAGTILGHEMKVGTIKATCQTYGLAYTYCARVDKDGNPCCSGNYIDAVVTTIEVLNKEGKKEELTLTFELPESAVVLTKQVLAKDNKNHPIPTDANGNEIVTRIPATCTTDGVEIYYCTACSKTPIQVSNILPKTGHTKGEAVNEPAHCQKKGYKGYLCTVCEEVVVTEWLTYTPKAIYNSMAEAKAAHTFEVYETYIKGSCETVGYYTAKCTEKKCGLSFYIKDETSGNHVMPEKLAAKPVNMALVFTEKGAHPVPAYDEAIYTWNSYDMSRSSYGWFEQVEGEWFFVVDSFKEDGQFALNLVMEVNEEYLKTAEFAGAEPTCTTNGWTAQFFCTKCETWVASETYIPAEETEDGKAVHPELAALNHPTKVVLVEAIKATCTTGGRTEGWYCSTCEQGEESVPTEALGHSWMFVDDFEVAKKYQGALYCCETCGIYTVQDYVPVCEHNFVLDRESCIPATCYLNKFGHYGVDVYVCTICGIDSPVYLEKADHVNKDGVVINECSFAADSKVDNVCVNCPKESNKITFVGVHAWTEIGYYDATCTERGYIVYDCDYCSEKKVEYITAKPAGHKWGEPTYVYGDKNNTDIIAAIYKCMCVNCDETKKEAVDSLLFTFDILNAANEKGEITDGTLVKVVINVTANGDEFWGFKLNLPYSENLTYVDFAPLSEDFLVYANANVDKDLKTQWISIAGNASADVAIEGKTALVALYFRVAKADRLNTEGALDKNGNPIPEAISVGETVYNKKGEAINEVKAEVTNMAGTRLPYVYLEESANTVVLMELDGAEKISVSDILVAYKAMLDGEYKAAADINKNGVVDTDDIIAMYNYLVGTFGYEDVVKVGV